eukprot:5199522-Lingulodinium_polyedra.AAC.1
MQRNSSARDAEQRNATRRDAARRRDVTSNLLLHNAALHGIVPRTEQHNVAIIIARRNLAYNAQRNAPSS